MSLSWLSCCSISRLMFRLRSWRVHHALDEAEVVGQQVGALLHDQHAGGIELQALLVVLGVEVVGGLAGDEQQGLVVDRALGAGA